MTPSAPVRPPSAGCRSCLQRRARPGELTNSSRRSSPCDRSHRVVAHAGRRRGGIGGWTTPHPPGPDARRALRRAVGGPGRLGPEVHGEAALVDALLGGPPGPGARRRLRHRPGGDRARPPRLRHRGRRRRPGAARPRRAPRRPTLTWQRGRPGVTPRRRRRGTVRGRGARRQRDDLRRARHRGARCSPTWRRGSRPVGWSSPGSSCRAGCRSPSTTRRATAAGLELRARWSTWDRAPFTEGDDYAVSVHEPISKR